MSSPDTSPKRRSIRSFVVRAGRMTKAQEKGLTEYWDHFGLNPGQAPDIVDAPSVLEIGFGVGDTLIEQVKQHPGIHFIGIEVHPPGVGHVLNELGKQELSNCRVYQNCAKDILENTIPKASIDKIQIFFPDPWHKSKHHKRRLIQTDMVELMAKAIKLDGFCHLATDWAPYAKHMKGVFEQSSEWKKISLSDMMDILPVGREETRFERRGLALGHSITDLVYQRVSSA